MIESEVRKGNVHQRNINQVKSNKIEEKQKNTQHKNRNTYFFFTFRYLRQNILMFIAYLLECAYNNLSFMIILNKIISPPKINSKLKVAIIPDGNRRYYKRTYGDDIEDEESSNEEFEKHPDFDLNNTISTTPQIKISEKAGGKWHGGQTLEKIIKYFRSGDEITVYCYSKQNFLQRNRSELRVLMKLLDKTDISKLGGKIRFIGEINLLKEKYQKIIRKIENHQNINTEFDCKNLNLCIIYSGMDELNGKYKSFIETPDILIRTGYQRRLSDYLLKQSGNGMNINFVSCLWPEMTEWHAFFIVMKYYIEKMI